ncbi:retrotransposon protein [Cucumis melo var. makuwa]|uniref:Retrotransposon protein n=1 Tax=Cucumis melo var. makuwa TaxID=1194695 RepID=A0A5A7T3P1_CUCMM|nr:retrotransposon protein [Cucumis melo var. makuwa]TYK03691.1 retrotransposon protein [Cucumis melo var. makuwa]
MKKKYQGTTRVKRQHLQALCKEFKILQMKQGEFVDEYFSWTLAIVNKMQIHREKIEDVAVVEKILRLMDSKFACPIEEQVLKTSTHGENSTERGSNRGHSRGRGRQLQEKSYVTTIKKGVCEIYDPRRGLIARVEMATNMFPPKLEGLQVLFKKQMVNGLPQISPPTKVCENCVVGKQHRESFPKGKAWGARKSVELIHSNICGP